MLLIMAGVLLHGSWEDGACVRAGIDTDGKARRGREKESGYVIEDSLSGKAQVQMPGRRLCGQGCTQGLRNTEVQK